MNHNSTGSLAGPKAMSNVEQAISDIDSLTEDLNGVAGELERALQPVLIASPPAAAGNVGAEPSAETELLTKLYRQQHRLRLLLGRYRELTSRVSI